VHLYEDSVVHTIVPMGESRQVAGFSGVVLDALAQMSAQERLEAFSSKTSTFNVADAEASGGR
ncbi:MAG TPA: phosphodiesterase, partial [Pseudolysinimonas sp.]|nr:phosphodiesterase [Pseudolysinimonas sp.]